jgi:hypothetical protein
MQLRRDESACALRGSGVTWKNESEGWFFSGKIMDSKIIF